MPGKIIGIGLNYRDHAAETGAQLPTRPLLFAKLPTSVAGPAADIVVPPYTDELDYEGELAVVIGRRCRDVAEADALDVVFGYAVMDDVSARDRQREEPQWIRAKGGDTMAPWGPWITTADEVPDPQALGIRTWVNDDLRQDGTHRRHGLRRGGAHRVLLRVVHARAGRRHHHRHPRRRGRGPRPEGVPATGRPGARRDRRARGPGQPGPMSPEEALARVLIVTGLSLPRGVLGPETWALARALGDEPGAGDPAALAGAASAAHWPELRGPMQAALLRARDRAAPEDQEAFEVVLEWAADDDPDTPLARALAVRAAQELAAANGRARAVLRAAEETVASGGAEAAVAASTAAGAIAADLLDLDPEDFAPEIAEYVAAGAQAEDVNALARATGDPEIRTWARSAVASAAEDDDAGAARRRRRPRAGRGAAARRPGRGPGVGADDPARSCRRPSSAPWPTRPPAISPPARRSSAAAPPRGSPQRSMLR